MKIIHIIPTLDKGGAERLAQDICIEIESRKKFNIKLITFKKGLKEIKSDLSFHKHINSIYVPSISSKPIIKVAELQKYINVFSPDIIHSHLWESEILLTKIDTKKAKRFSHFHDNIPQISKKIFLKNKIELTNKIERNNYLRKNSNKFICISNDTFKYANKELPNNLKKNIILLPNAINYKKLYSKKKRDFNKISLINIGSFVPKKNQIFVLKILNEILKLGEQANITFLGDGPLLNEVKQFGKKLRIDKYIFFKGNVDNIKPFLENSNIYIHTAKYEPFGLVLLEAMASGIPVISLNGKGNKDIINDQINGLLIDEENTEKFVKEIISIFKNKSRYKSLSKYGYLTAKKHDIKSYVDKLTKLYFSAMK